MKETAKDYVRLVMANITADAALKRRIEADLLAQIAAESENTAVALVLERMGPPEAVAQEFMESIYQDGASLLNEAAVRSRAYEYASPVRIFGWPLVHIHYRRSGKLRIAKGIIAIGDIAIGVIPVGMFALGGIGLGAFSVALFSLAGISLGVAAFGGIAVGQLAFGGLAVGKLAMGGLAIGKVAIGGKGIGRFVLDSLSAPVSGNDAVALVKSAFSGLDDWLLKLLTLPIRLLLGRN